MISAIGEAGLQQAVRPQYNAVVQTEETHTRENDQMRQERPVEKTEDSQHPKMDMDQNGQGETTSQNRIEEGKVLVEQYDEKGRMVRVTPPGYLPLSETV